MNKTAMAPNNPTLLQETMLAPFGHLGGLSESASVWVCAQYLSGHKAKDFTQTLYPSTCKGSFPFCIAEANSWMVLLKFGDGVDVDTIPRAFLSAKMMVMSRLSWLAKLSV